MTNIVGQIVEKRKKDIEKKGYTFGFEIPAKRDRPLNPFMQDKGVILEVKRASPARGILPQILIQLKLQNATRKTELLPFPVLQKKIILRVL